ncbi:KAP family P-loop NTPase fold protein [Geomonas ferrireducens]|uniref:KAP family P-loop NTPase fold protein n=1 Tax=Geomonas ferrireducens TaxID=2570227 RepID=UPI0010A7F864|nr:P-loop NTPase fold protein [Geomonas ferrireducens]
MKIVVPAPYVPPETPFANDKLKREPFANALTNLVQNLDDPAVITIDAPWGEGKTTFAKMWRASLKSKNCRCIYIDAFANDYLDDPFVVLVGEIATYIQETYSAEHPIFSSIESVLKKASRAGVKLLSFGTKIGLKAATLGILKDNDFKDMEEIKEAVTNDSFDFANNLFEKKLRDHKADAATVEDFKNTLSDFAKQIKEDTSYPLVLIIDELDRCRPTYAVDFIEKIKHIFSVENVIFTLILNKNQLAAAVSSIYGEKLEATQYLQKFFTIETSLSKNEDDVNDDYRAFCNHVYNALGIDAGNDVSSLQSTMIGLSELFSLSFRDIEKCYSHIALYYGAKSLTFNMAPLVSFLVIVKVRYPQYYGNFRSGSSLEVIEAAEVYQKLVTNIKVLEKHHIQKLIPMLHFCTLTQEKYKAIDPEDRDITSYEQFLWHINLEREDVIPLISRRLDLFNIVQQA